MLLLNSQYPLQSMVMSATRYGVWSANIHTTRDVTVQVGDTVQVQCWDLTLIGRIRSGGLYTGTGRYQVVGGGGNWGRIIPPIAHSSAGGILSSLVLESIRQAANAAGAPAQETLRLLSDPYLGAFWSRASGTAATALSEVTGGKWWVGYDGVTVVGERPTTTVTTPYVVEDYEPIYGDVVVSVPQGLQVAQFMPGCTITTQGTSLTAQEVSISATGDEGVRIRLKA